MRSVHAGVVMIAFLVAASCSDRREAAAVPQPQTVTLAISGMT
jgi:hypothetical protein